MVNPKDLRGFPRIRFGIAKSNPVPPPPISTPASHPPRAIGWVSLLLGLTGTAVLSATAGALLAVSLASTPLMQRQLTSQESSVFNQGTSMTGGANLSFPDLTRPVNILILGIKVLSTEVGNPPPETKRLSYQATINSVEGLSDVILVLRFDPKNQRLAILSIPRDTRVNIMGYGIDKLNAANVYGGPALSATTTSHLLGDITIDRYVRINVQGVEKLVNALGGVTVLVPKDLKYRDDSQRFYVDLKAGRQHLNGDQVLQLLRFRYDGYGDIGRIQRQQLVMRALAEQSLTPAILPKIPALLSVVQSHIDTNLSVEELLALVGFTTQLNQSNTELLMLPGDFGNGGSRNQISYWIPDHSRITNLIARYFDQGFETTISKNGGDLKIALQDSLGQKQPLQKLRFILMKSGFSTVYSDTGWTEPLLVTRIIAQRGNVEDAARVRRQLGFGEIRTESTGNLNSDVTIQIGQDWLRHLHQFNN